jgi:uncharacterized membrane protein YhdT
MVLTLFTGEKSSVYWAGLVILRLASWFLFSSLWTIRGYGSFNLGLYFESSIPVIAGTVLFILIGFYMMKSGVKDEKS